MFICYLGIGFFGESFVVRRDCWLGLKKVVMVMMILIIIVISIINDVVMDGVFILLGIGFGAFVI